MSLISYVRLVQLREADDYDELRRSQIIMVEKSPDAGIHGPRVVVPAHKEMKWRKQGYRPVDEVAGEAERVLRESAFAKVRAQRNISAPAVEQSMDELSTLQGFTILRLRSMVRAAGYNITTAARKDDLIALLLQAKEPQEVS